MLDINTTFLTAATKSPSKVKISLSAKIYPRENMAKLVSAKINPSKN